MEGAASTTEAQPPTGIISSPAGAREFKNLHRKPVLAVWGGGPLKKKLLPAKRQGAVTRGECLNSPTSPSHSPTISSKSTNMVEKEMARSKPSSKFLNPDPWARLIGRANEEKIKVNGHTVTALVDTGSQVTHISLEYCQAMGIPINPIDQLVHIEGAGGML